MRFKAPLTSNWFCIINAKHRTTEAFHSGSICVPSCMVQNYKPNTDCSPTTSYVKIPQDKQQFLLGIAVSAYIPKRGKAPKFLNKKVKI